MPEKAPAPWRRYSLRSSFWASSATGLFGAGMRTIQDRETNVLRRFKVAPISPGPVIIAALISGLVNFIPIVILFLLFARIFYHAPIPPNSLSLIIFVSIGVLAFRAIGHDYRRGSQFRAGRQTS